MINLSSDYKRRRGAFLPTRGAVLLSLVLLGLVHLAPHLLDNGGSSSSSTSPLPCNSGSNNIKRTSALRAAAILDEENQNKCSSESNSNIKISSLLSVENANYLTSLIEKLGESLRPKILLAQAHQASQEKGREIFDLTAANFNPELIQHESPFPHIKLIEYYVPFCRFCKQLASTYDRLASDIHAWRNVIRPVALNVAGNSLVLQPWSIEEVPSLKFYPPVNATIAAKFNELHDEWNKTMPLQQVHQNVAKLFNTLTDYKAETLNLNKYLENSKLLKSDLLNYIERYAIAHEPNDLPATWPNLRPVSEPSLLQLRKTHPRKELFLVVEGARHQSSSAASSLGLATVMELSSTTSWKSVRYVRASENRPLIENVIMQLKRVIERKSQDGNSHDTATAVATEQSKQQGNNSIQEQIELLTKLMNEQEGVESDGKSATNSLVLVHIDDSHQPVKRSEQLASTAIPSMTIVTGSDLVNSEQQLSGELTFGDATASNNVNTRARRAAAAASDDQTGKDAQATAVKFDDLSNEKKIELVASHIKQVYTETLEDRAFATAIELFDKDITIRGDENHVVKKFSSESKKSSLHRMKQSVEESRTSPKFPQVLESFNPHRLLSQVDQDEYEDKIKAIHYILFSEVPRRLATLNINNNKNPPNDKLEKLNTLVNLVSVIKSYFPLPDSSSIHFIDGVLNYLTSLKQQDLMTTSTPTSAAFTSQAFKQELKRLESEGKQLPQIREWKSCKYGGYPCALWRLFHTLTAFEYRKLSQIYHVESSTFSSVTSSSQSQSPIIGQQQAIIMPQHQEPAMDSNNNNHQVLANAEQIVSTNSTGSEQENSAPVERLVSPPSTTTSLSLTIDGMSGNNNNNTLLQIGDRRYRRPTSQDLAELPLPVILVMRDYISNFFSCEECVKHFKIETADLSLDRIRQQEPAEFSILWLWETHNRVNKRLSVDLETNPKEHPKVWFPTYEQCQACYLKPPSFLNAAASGSAITTSTSVDSSEMFKEAIEWNRQEVLAFLMREYTKQPMDGVANIFGYQVPHMFGYIFVASILCLLGMLLLRCAACYIERQRRHKATLLNGNGAHYTMELQRS